MKSTLSALSVMGMYPSSAKSYDMLAVYRPEWRSECIVTGIRTPANFPYDMLAAYGPPVAAYGSLEWRVPALPARVVLQELGDACSTV